MELMEIHQEDAGDGGDGWMKVIDGKWMEKMDVEGMMEKHQEDGGDGWMKEIDRKWMEKMD